MDRHRRIGAVAMVLIVAAVASCGPFEFAGRANETARLHEQADAALARWVAAVAAAGGQQDFVPTEGMTGQVGDWEVDVGDNNKPALMAGLVESATQLPDDVPPKAEIRWNDGTTKTVPTNRNRPVPSVTPSGSTAPGCRRQPSRPAAAPPRRRRGNSAWRGPT